MQALLAAAKDGQVELVRALISEGADVDDTDASENTALIWAAFKGHTACVELLIDAKANIEARNDNAMTALMRATQGGHPACVRRLIDGNADVDARNKFGESALLIAVQCGYIRCMEPHKCPHLPCAQLLIDANANLEIEKRRNGDTALLASLYERRFLRILIEAKANIEAKNFYGHTLLMCAAIKCCSKTLQRKSESRG